MKVKDLKQRLIYQKNQHQMYEDNILLYSNNLIIITRIKRENMLKNICVLSVYARLIISMTLNIGNFNFPHFFNHFFFPNIISYLVPQ